VANAARRLRAGAIKAVTAPPRAIWVKESIRLLYSIDTGSITET
jgi:hypothetical protein